jgi:nitrogen fixation protein NifB
MAELQVSHVTLTINAVDPVIGSEIYAWVRDGKRPLRGEEAAAVLSARQIDALVKLKSRGITTKVNTIIMPGVNDDHIHDVAKKVSALGADIMNLMPLVPVKGAAFEDVSPPDTMTTARLRLQCGQLLPQMTHCARCRADAVGYIGENMSTKQHDALNHYAKASLNPAENDARLFVAVATMEGVLVNQHLGESERFIVYEPDVETPGNFRLKEIRSAPAPGGGDARWAELASTLKDCRALLVNAAGPTPMKVLTQHGLKVIEMEGLIDEGLRAVFADKPIYLADCGVVPTFGAIAAARVAFQNLVEVAQAAYEFERANTAGIHAAYEAALAEKDYPVQVMLHWFISEQVEEEAWPGELLAKTREASCAGAMLNLDRHLAKILNDDATES